MEKLNKEKAHCLFSRYILNRNEDNLELLYNEYKKTVYAIAFSILKNSEDANDIVQIVFIKIHTMNIKQLPHSFELSWLYTITKNESINLLKKSKNMVNIDEIYSLSNTDNEIDNLIDKIYFNNLIKKLSPCEKEIISLRVLSKMSFKEISIFLKIPLGTVEWKYYKAIKNIKGMLGSFILFVLTLVIGNIRDKNEKTKFNNNIKISTDEGKTNIDKEQENTTNTNDFADRENISSNEIISETQTNDNIQYQRDWITNGFFISSFLFLCITIIIIIKNIKNKK